MVQLCEVPEQLFATGVTVMVAVVVMPGLFVVNDAIVPVPLAASPIDVALFTQLYVVPLTEEPVKCIVLVLLPPHTV